MAKIIPLTNYYYLFPSQITSCFGTYSKIIDTRANAIIASRDERLLIFTESVLKLSLSNKIKHVHVVRIGLNCRDSSSETYMHFDQA